MQAADWGNEKQQVEMAIQSANKEFEEKALATERQRQGWESAQRNYENQIADLTAKNEELTKNITELDEMTSEEREQLQNALMGQTKEADSTISKLSSQVEVLSKSVMELETEKEALERGWSDRFIQIESDWKDRLNKSMRDNDRSKAEIDQVALDSDRRIELLERSHLEERNSMEARIKQLQSEIERERDEQDKIREESRALRIEIEQTSGKNESTIRASQRDKKQLEKERDDANRLREKEREQFVAERAQLENYLRSVSEHVKALQDSSNANNERFNAERTKLEDEIEALREEGKTKQDELRRERDQLQIELARLRTQLKQDVEQKTEEANLLQGKVARLEKSRNDLEAQLEHLAKTKNMSEQELAEMRETHCSTESKLESERSEFERVKEALEEALKGKNKQVEDLTAQLLQSQLHVQTVEKDSADHLSQKDAQVQSLRKDLERAKVDFDEFKRQKESERETMELEHEENVKKIKRESSNKLNELNEMMMSTRTALEAEVANKDRV